MKLAWAFSIFETPEYPGCVDKSELSFVMARAGFNFTLEDHANAIYALDTLLTGKIHLVSFINWWFENHFRRPHPARDHAVNDNYIYDVHGGQASTKSQLIKIQSERRMTDMQVRQLKTRILLLKKSEGKAWRDIRNTKLKIAEALKLQKEEEQREREMEAYNKEKSIKAMQEMEAHDKRFVDLELRRLARMVSRQCVCLSPIETNNHSLFDFIIPCLHSELLKIFFDKRKRVH